ncbi:hypothetical protein N7532_005131 [Penicillium argentinense]|uniref:Uncharacterized protein n=1 Tax=Penicillium argentinense TaxID=1131581 RepID=A0A9W9K9P2_9EURO|nr:uncharacterized protein N7532_005131 [Penicillium argentinense]KAJ5098130.1 hypothetical protein N7532_005131 [Penicillium argentinense]
MASNEDMNLYSYYVPNKIVAIVFAAIFIVLTALHMWRIIATRQWFGIAIIIGGLFEIVGLAARAYGHSHLNQLGPFIVQYVLVLLAPILYTAAVYMFLGRLIRVSGHPKLSFIRINWITKIFVVGDILCFLVQAFGGVSLANLANSKASDTAHKVDIAKNVILAGLALQVIFFLIFTLCSVIFHVRVSKRGIAETVDPTLHINIMLLSIYVTAFLITGRNVYRLVEYKSGTSGYLQEHEWPTYGLDVGLMALFMVITFFWYLADTKARVHGAATGNGKYGRVYDKDHEGAWSGNVHDDQFPLAQANTNEENYPAVSANVHERFYPPAQTNAYESGYGNPQSHLDDSYAGRGYGNTYNSSYGRVHGEV